MPSKSGRHHNKNGLRQIKSGSLERRTRRLAHKLRIPYGTQNRSIKNLIARAYYDGIQKGLFGIVDNGTTGALELADIYASKILRNENESHSKRRF